MADADAAVMTACVPQARPVAPMSTSVVTRARPELRFTATMGTAVSPRETWAGFSSEDVMRLRDEQAGALLLASRETHDVEIDCEEFLAVMAKYAEARLGGKPIVEDLQRAQEHERLCANCREELAALFEMVADTKR
jgi:hypothetical protein